MKTIKMNFALWHGEYDGCSKGARMAAVVCGTIMALTGGGTDSACAHGFVGDRFFPPTIATDDPFATDELLLPAVSYFKSPAAGGSPSTATVDGGFEFDKEIFPKFALGLAGDYLSQKPEGQPSARGFDDFSLSAKYQLWQNDRHEAIFSVGAQWNIGGSGNKNVGADTGNTFTPTLYFGKGLGDLPDSWKYARPFAITGTLGEALPDSAEPDSLQWGIAVEYSLPYLQSQVKDIGLPAPFKSMIPVVEAAVNNPENRNGGPMTGTINPGVFYESRYFQLGAEAVIPINHTTGHSVGAVVQLEIFIDDIWPQLFGHPIFGK